jgi:pimeloyl-ACP methyl ester carboxylesterase
MMTVAVRPNPERLRAFVASMAMPSSTAALRHDPWRPVVEQFAVGVSGFRTRLDEAKPLRCRLERLRASAVPTLVVIGADESLHDGPVMAERFRAQLPNARVELVEGANHLIFVDQSKRVAELLTEFLR